VWLCASVCWAQEFRATVTGRVLDQSGSAVPSVPVQVQNVDTNETSAGVTDSQGSFTVPFLRPGNYTLRVEAPGFKKAIRDGLTLQVGQTATININLEVGAVTEQVTVTGEAPMLETAKADRGRVIAEQEVRELPLNARNPFMLSILSAGVNYNSNIIYQRPFDNGAIATWSINGSWNSNNEFLLDGAPNNAQAGGNNIALVPPVDSVQEFKIQTNSFDAQYGKTMGGIVNVSLKGGTNQVHGTLYEFARRNQWDANSFQNNSKGIPKVAHFLDQYGGAIGGPIYIPKLYDGRNKSFFFVNYEGYREGTPTPLFLNVPAPEMLQGDFSKLKDANGQKITIYDPATGHDVNGVWTRDAFPGNIIPSARLNPIALKILGYQPKPNTVTPGQGYTTQNFFVAGGDNLDKDDFYNLVIKLDQNFGDRNHVFFRHASNDRTEMRLTNGVIGVGEDGPRPLKRVNDAYVIDWVGTLKPTLIANFRISFNRYLDPSYGHLNEGFDFSTLGFPKSLESQIPGIPSFGRYEFSGYNNLGRYYGGSWTNTWAAHPTLTWIKGSQTIKAGVDMRWIQYATKNVGNPFRLNFDKGATQKEYNRGDSNSGDAIASALLGIPSTTNSLIDYNTFPAYMYRYFAPYMQDDWKVSRKLTLNLGLRWDFNISANERYNRLAAGFDPNAVNPVDKLIDRTKFPDFPTIKGVLLFAGQNGANTRASKIDWTAFQPRFGFAYQAVERLVVRGGIGKYYLNPNNDDLRSPGFSYTTPLINSPDAGRTFLSNVLNNPFPNGPVIPPGSSLGGLSYLGRNPDFFDQNFHLPYVYQFSFGFQYMLTKGSTIEASYVGNRTYKLESNMSYNEPNLAFRKKCNPLEGGDPAYCDALVPNPFYGLQQFAGTNLGSNPTISRFDLNRPFPEFTGFNEYGRNDGHVWYNSLQITYNQRYSGGLSLNGAYTFSKMIERWGFNDTQAGVLQQGVYPWDRPHAFKLGTVWELPFGKGRKFFNTSNAFLSRVASGWQHTMIFQYTSGRPWDMNSNNVQYVSEAKLPNIDWNASLIRGVQPCVARYNSDNSISLQPYSVAYGCTSYNFLILPRYAPHEAPYRDGRLRGNAEPQFDMSLNKTTQIRERMSIQFRAEAFNVFNKFYFPLENFVNDPNNANYGAIVKSSVSQGNANFPRQIQFAVKFIF
jgi:hypothetical protein